MIDVHRLHSPHAGGHFRQLRYFAATA